MTSKIPGTCYSGKKKAPARNAPGLVRMGFTKIHGFPGFGLKDLSTPRDDKTKNDAMVNLYPLECPKLIILPNKLKIQGNRSKPTTDPADTSPPWC